MKRVTIVLAFVLSVLLIPTQGSASNGQFPQGHGYSTYYESYQGPGYEVTVYVDETFAPAKGTPLLVGKTWIEGTEPNFVSKPLCPTSPEQAQWWWGDRSRMDLSGAWRALQEGDRTAWVRHTDVPELLVARFGILQVHDGFLIGGESRYKRDVTARCISPITGNFEVGGQPQPDTICFTDVNTFSSVVGGYSSNWERFAFNGWKFNPHAGQVATLRAPDRGFIDAPGGRVYSGQHVQVNTTVTLWCEDLG